MRNIIIIIFIGMDVILDTEGIMNLESDNRIFDNQIATMAVLASNLIIFNTKGELKPDLAGIIGITLYAKLEIGKTFKPSVLFILRDQKDRSQSNVQIQGQKLKEILIKNTEFLPNTVDSLLKIDPKNIILLPDAFSLDTNKTTKNEYQWRNEIFPIEILNLRQLVLNQLFSDNNISHYDSMRVLYERMVEDLSTLERLGDGILNC